MSGCTVTFHPPNITVKVESGTSLLEAVSKAGITINNLCGGDGICGRCKMIVKEGEIEGEISGKLSREEIKKGYVLACISYIKSDLVIEIPEETLAKERKLANRDARRFVDLDREISFAEEYTPSPLVTKIYLELEKPSLANNTADHQRICDLVRKKLKYRSMQMGLKIIQTLPEILRKNDYSVTATVGLRRDLTEIMNVEGGNTCAQNYMVVIDMGTTTLVAHLVDTNTLKTIGAEACFNSQGIYGREVTARMIMAEKRGTLKLQKLLVEDINRLISSLAEEHNINHKDITAVVCAGNTAMGHFLVGLPTQNIRRSPYISTSVELPPLRAAEVGIQINPRGLLYSLPGISGWVGSDLTAGILATGIHEKEELSLLVDIGTNGEIVVGNSEWLVACSASAGPALEGAGQECGMRAEAGAIERVSVENGEITYSTIGNQAPQGICGSGIIDLVSVLLNMGIINRNGQFTERITDISAEKGTENEASQDNQAHSRKEERPPEEIYLKSFTNPGREDRIKIVEGSKRFLLVCQEGDLNGKCVYITESDINNIITAKAAIFAAMKILMERLELQFRDIRHFYIAGAFGNYINLENAINIGLIPNIPRDRIKFVGNTSIRGAKIAAFYKEAFYKIVKIQRNTTYYDLMGAPDYIEEFRKALFLPHTDIELFKEHDS